MGECDPVTSKSFGLKLSSIAATEQYSINVPKESGRSTAKHQSGGVPPVERITYLKRHTSLRG